MSTHWGHDGRDPRGWSACVRCLQSTETSAHCNMVRFETGCLVGLVVESVTAAGSIPGSDKVLLGFSIRDFSVTVTDSGFVPD